MTAKPPVAIRITRPHQTEDEFLAAELDTISRTGVVLVGAQQRPEGVVLRFELTLASGAPLLRGEGRVVGFKPNVVGNESGLALRFTRLDSKSKSLVDRVNQMQGDRREQRRSLAPPPPSGETRQQQPEAPQPEAPAPAPPPTPAPDPLASSGEIPVSVDVPASADPPQAGRRNDEAKPSVAQAQDRSGDRFARLRERASRISAEQAAQILADGAARRSRKA
ncbi:MAG TPA: hypothetical protein VGH87_12375 [Polyangiaceae bacterium]